MNILTSDKLQELVNEMHFADLNVEDVADLVYFPDGNGNEINTISLSFNLAEKAMLNNLPIFKVEIDNCEGEAYFLGDEKSLIQKLTQFISENEDA